MSEVEFLGGTGEKGIAHPDVQTQPWKLRPEGRDFVSDDPLLQEDKSKTQSGFSRD